jgi:serralysin
MLNTHLSILPDELIDQAAVSFSRQIATVDGTFSYYLHRVAGPVLVSGGTFGEQTIQAIAIPESDQRYFRDIVTRLDAILELDFRESLRPQDADLDLYYDSEINIEGTTDVQTLGLAIVSGSSWELYLNAPPVLEDQNFRQYIQLHELGHALGLEHPFDSTDGDAVNGISDPWLSSYAHETVMAYRKSEEQLLWPQFFSNNDIRALIEIWGIEPSRLEVPSIPSELDNLNLSLAMLSWNDDVFYGSSLPDRVNGSRGEDFMIGGAGDDIIRGGQDNDSLRGDQGADALFGDRGFDLIRGGKGDDLIHGNMGNDRLYGDLGNDYLRGGRDDDWIDGGPGDDQLWGDYGADRFRLSAGNDVIWDFSYAAGDRLELAPDAIFSVKQVAGDLEIWTDVGSTTLPGLNLSQFSDDWFSYRDYP